MRKALVTSASGFIGSHLIEGLKSDGYWVRGVSRVMKNKAPVLDLDSMAGDPRRPGL